MITSSNFKKEAALVASVPRTTIRRHAVRTAIRRLKELPPPAQWPQTGYRLASGEFDDFQEISRKILREEKLAEGDVLRLQMYAAMIYEAIDRADEDEVTAFRAK